MDNQYIFIIWNKALFAKDKIISDLKKSFEIKKQFYIKWNKENFEKNLKVLYGIKCNNPKQKIRYIGSGKFLILIVQDDNPKYDYRKQQNKDELVNANIYDKKALYRKWTAYNFRVHSSVSDIETKHDLTILLGPDYNNIINNLKNNETINIDTKGIIGFKSVDEFIESLNLFDGSKVEYKDNNLYINTNNGLNLLYFIDNKKIININGINYNIVIEDDNNENKIIDNKDSFLRELKNNLRYYYVRFRNKY
jgi:hypothetical protein